MPSFGKPTVAVIGGGITGLSAAYFLTRSLPASRVLLFEASRRLGGVIRTTRPMDPYFLVESGPDCFVTEKPAALELCRELGLEGEIIPTQKEHRKSFVVKGGRLHPVPGGFYLIGPSRIGSFLTSPLLSWKGKLRALMEPWRPRAGDGTGDESLASFVRRRFGPELLERLAQPLVAGIYAADPETLSLRATFPRFLEMEETSGSVLKSLVFHKRALSAAEGAASGARYGLFATLRNGMQTLTDKLEASLPPGSVRKNSSVRSLKNITGGGRRAWRIEIADGETVEAETVCLALPAYGAGTLLEQEFASLAGLLNAIPYADSATVHLGCSEKDVDHPLNGFGFVSPRIEGRFLSACTFAHRKFEGRAPERGVLLRGFIGGEAAGEGDAVLLEKTIEDLKSLIGLKGEPFFLGIDRHRRAMPQYAVGHPALVEEISRAAALLPGFTLAGNYLRGVGIPDCIASARAAVDALLSRLPRPSCPPVPFNS